MSGGGVMLSGWLRKSPPENKLKSRHHSWKKRWFVLKSGRLTGDPNVLEYSKYQTSKKPIKTINLNDCTQIDVNVSIPIRTDKKDLSEHFIFSIVTHPRTFYLITDSIREMSSWVQCLCDLCGFNHDSTDKGDLGRQKQTFRAAQPTSLNVNGTASTASSSLLPTGTDIAPVPVPRPEKTSTSMASKPVAPNPTVAYMQNGAVNTSFNYPSQNGYDFPEEEETTFNGGESLGMQPNGTRQDFYQQRSQVLPPHMPIMPPPEDPDTTGGYLHLKDCETVSSNPNSALLVVEKTDMRRVSTDSVFTHGDGSDESKDEESPTIPSNIPSKSRFVDPLRLDSMPSVPPPPPPTDVPPHTQFDDDDGDVMDARRKPTLSRPSRLPPIEDIYNVPPGLHHSPGDSQHWQGSSSSTSYGSSYSGNGRYTGKILSPPEYINTSDGKSSGSFSGAGHPSASSFSSPGPQSISPANIGHQVYDVPSPRSPVFPMSSPRTSYQVPQSLERTIASRNVGVQDQTTPSKMDTAIRNQLKEMKMLDVNAMSTINPDLSTYTSAQDLGISRTSDNSSGMNSESPYAIPPARPPKPVQPQMQNMASECLYSSPRNHSASSAGSIDHGTYDTVKRPSPLSPPHTTVIGSFPDSQKNSQSMLGALSISSRNAISASNTPMATPDLSRRVEINKTPSFNSQISPLVQQSKAVSGSAPSLYDVPQALIKSPTHGLRQEPRSSQSSSTSGDGSAPGSSVRNSAADTSVYDMPRKSSDTGARPLLQHQDTFHKVDDHFHPSYEKMASQPNINNEVQDNQNPYTVMAGVLSTPNMQVPRQDIPPPVHRDLKPGRKSLGSDGGSSQSGLDRKKNSRDSYESDEAISPPHTTVLHTIPIVTETKPFQYGPSFSPMGSRSGSITSPQHAKLNRGDDFNNSRLSISPIPPQRPPKSSFSSLSPRSPTMATPSGQLPGRAYTPTHNLHKSPQVGHDRHLTNPSPSFSNVPERPPKPANMRFNTISTPGWDDTRMPPRRPPKSSDDHGFAPSRPPKPSMTTPSTGDSLFSTGSLHSSFFPISTSSYGPSSIVPPPPTDQIEREIKYIEISTQSNTRGLPPSDNSDRNVSQEPIQYIELDVDKTRALEMMKRERQNKLQQRANSEAHSVGKCEDSRSLKKI